MIRNEKSKESWEPKCSNDGKFTSEEKALSHLLLPEMEENGLTLSVMLSGSLT